MCPLRSPGRRRRSTTPPDPSGAPERLIGSPICRPSSIAGSPIRPPDWRQPSSSTNGGEARWSGMEKPDPDRPIEEWTDNDRFINVSSSRAHAREQKGPSARPAAKAWRLRGPLARTTSVLSTRSMTARACAFAKALLKAAVLVWAASRIASEPRKAPSTPSARRAHGSSSPIPCGPSSVAGRARKGQRIWRETTKAGGLPPMTLSHTAAFALLSATVSSVIARRRLWVHPAQSAQLPTRRAESQPIRPCWRSTPADRLSEPSTAQVPPSPAIMMAAIPRPTSTG